MPKMYFFTNGVENKSTKKIDYVPKSSKQFSFSFNTNAIEITKKIKLIINELESTFSFDYVYSFLILARSLLLYIVQETDKVNKTLAEKWNNKDTSFKNIVDWLYKNRMITKMIYEKLDKVREIGNDVIHREYNPTQDDKIKIFYLIDELGRGLWGVNTENDN